MQYEHLCSVVALFLPVCTHLKKETRLVLVPEAFQKVLSRSSLVEVVPIEKKRNTGSAIIKYSGGDC